MKEVNIFMAKQKGTKKQIHKAQGNEKKDKTLVPPTVKNNLLCNLVDKKKFPVGVLL